ncbi:MAG: hypothetical protein IK088_08165, partial [Lachnospiraceae bacterium]|nr:hypothetical protein [Lachnospiraceae bacterium]
MSSLWNGISGFFGGLIQLFNIPLYVEQLNRYKDGFNILAWILATIVILLTYAIIGGIIFLIVLAIRKYVRFRKSIVGNEDLLEEIADLHKDVINLTAEKEKLLALKIGPTGFTYDDLRAIFEEQTAAGAEGQIGVPNGGQIVAGPGTTVITNGGGDGGSGSGEVISSDSKRFFRLSAVDEKYSYYTPPAYDDSMNLEQLCDDIRNFACSRGHLYYEIKIIRLMLAGLASTKLILLQGISGTGKTSLPYIMGKYFQNDATIASVQPSWRDRTELFGYFNEFTKKFNETEVLRRIYEASYN